jgi:tetratricopeptide (TPR) repeat protein
VPLLTLNSQGLIGGTGEPALIPLTFGQLLKQTRIACGLSQAEAGRPVMTKAFVSLLERDRARPSASTLRHLARQLESPLAHFLSVLDARTVDRVLADFDRQAQAALSQRRYSAAHAGFLELGTLARANGSARTDVAATLGLGETLLGLRNIIEARDLLQEALERARRLPDRLMECRALTGLGLVAHRCGELDEAVTRYRAALELIPALAKPAPVLHGELLLYMSTMMFRLGNLEGSRHAALESLGLLDAHAPHRGAEARMNLGVVYYRSGEYGRAAEEYRHALRIAEQFEDLQTIFRVRKNLAMVLIEAGEPRAALEHLTMSVTMARRLGDVTGECQALTELGRCRLAVGAVAEARTTAEEAVARSRGAGKSDEVARASIVLGAATAATHQSQKALRYLSDAYRHSTQAGMRFEAIVAGRILARLTLRSGKPAQADRLYSEVFAALRHLAPHEAYGVLQMAKTYDRAIDPAFEPVPIPVQ